MTYACGHTHVCMHDLICEVACLETKLACTLYSQDWLDMLMLCVRHKLSMIKYLIYDMSLTNGSYSGGMQCTCWNTAKFC